MRAPLVMATALFGGCYSPTITPGAPCDPAIGNCPRPLECAPGPTGATCELPGTQRPDAPVTEPDAAIDASPDARADAMIDAMTDAALDAPAPLHLEYPSMVADCVDPTAPDPDLCINKNGNGRMAVDLDDSSAGNPWDGFVRFDLDNMIAGRVVTSVKLRMSTPSDGSASAPNSGVVFQVGSFTRLSLFTAEPAVIGAQLAGSQGSVSPNMDVLWPLPTTLPVANGSVFLKITTPSSDGTLYYNQTGTRPPRLIIDLQ